MARKRKNGDTVVRVVRQHTDPHCHRIVSVHRTPAGRLGQSTSFVSCAPDATSPATNEQLDPCMHEFFEPSPLPSDNPISNQPSRPSKQSSPLTDWVTQHRQSYLDEMMRHDGRGGEKHCMRCGADGLYKCSDCFGFQLLCCDCIVKEHTHLPLHRLLYWNGKYFEDTHPKSLGINVYLGHRGEPCKITGDVIKDFTIVDINGIHCIDVYFCCCYQSPGASHHRIQLLRSGLLPSSHVRPLTAFTFNLLDSFHLLTLQGKTSAYDFYLSIARKSDNTGTLNVKYRYEQFLTAIRIWRHLKLIKRSGRAYDPRGVAATKPGDCAVECPACPNPQQNLPPDWNARPLHERWLYTLILTVDANFRLKNKARTVKDDPPLGNGWAHWVEEKPYKEYIRKYGYQIEPNLCDSDLRAVDHANKKYSKGYKATGVGGVICARHCLVRKNGLGDLQKGERYANMDFLVLSTLVGVVITSLMISYDIVCQWSRRLQKRNLQFPSFMQLPPTMLNVIKYVIPKFHIYGHGAKCQTKFSLNFLKHSARTDGEEPERWWAHINPVSMSTREMGSGSRRDTIDDHAAAWNWRKITNFGNTLLTKLQEVVEMKSKHNEILSCFTAKISPDVVKKWSAMIDAWDLDQSKPDPYEESQKASTMTDVRLELAKEELVDVQMGAELSHEIPPHDFLHIGLDLEEQQRILRQSITKDSTSSESAEVQGRRTTLHQRIRKWREAQVIYMPTSSTVLDGDDEDHTVHPEQVKLYLPSGMPKHLWPSEDLVNKEIRLRIAQANDSLNELRRLLRITLGLWEYKYTQLGPSQRAGTRARSMIQRFKGKIDRAAETYRTARTALLALDPNGSWSRQFLELKPRDVKGPGRGKDDESEGRRELSWIWLAPSGSDKFDTSASEEEIGDSLRAEWAKTRARAGRWSEEVLQLVEEMRRILWSLKQKATWWISQQGMRIDVRSDIQEGLVAYSEKQSALRWKMGMQFADQWHRILAHNHLPMEWPQEFLVHSLDLPVPHIPLSVVHDDAPLPVDDE